MTRKPNEPWMDFIDRYCLFAATCTQVSEAVRTAELFRKLPRELRMQLSHMKHDTTLTAMREAVCGIRYWSQCARDKTVPFDPMEVDVHECQAREPIRSDRNDDDFGVDYGFRQGDGCFQRPVNRIAT